jgi:heme/copper-type cytochrome/quinol oxidase subunit 3
MTSDADGFLEEGPPRGLAVERMKELSWGAWIVLGGGLLLFFSLFLTWQHLEIDYGRTGTGTEMLDAFDALGLVIAMLTLALVTLVFVAKVADVDTSPDVAWELYALILSVVILGLVVAKTLTDRDSAWGSYVGLTLAAVVVVGAYLDWMRSRPGGHSLVRNKRRRAS